MGKMEFEKLLEQAMVSGRGAGTEAGRAGDKDVVDCL